jgi:hypothetical protein
VLHDEAVLSLLLLVTAVGAMPWRATMNGGSVNLAGSNPSQTISNDINFGLIGLLH